MGLPLELARSSSPAKSAAVPAATTAAADDVRVEALPTLEIEAAPECSTVKKSEPHMIPTLLRVLVLEAGDPDPGAPSKLLVSRRCGEGGKSPWLC